MKSASLPYCVIIKHTSKLASFAIGLATGLLFELWLLGVVVGVVCLMTFPKDSKSHFSNGSIKPINRSALAQSADDPSIFYIFTSLLLYSLGSVFIKISGALYMGYTCLLIFILFWGIVVSFEIALNRFNALYFYVLHNYLNIKAPSKAIAYSSCATLIPLNIIVAYYYSFNAVTDDSLLIVTASSLFVAIITTRVSRLFVLNNSQNFRVRD